MQHQMQELISMSARNPRSETTPASSPLAYAVVCTAMVKSGSSYLSQSELPLTFRLGRRESVDRVVIRWPSGRTDEHGKLAGGRTWLCREGSAPSEQEK